MFDEVKFICCPLPPLNVYFTKKHTLLAIDDNFDPPLFAYISAIVKKHIPESSKYWTVDWFGKDISQIHFRVDMYGFDEIVIPEGLYPMLTLINVS